MTRARNENLSKPISIRFTDWKLFGDQKLRAPHFIMLPMQFRNEHRWDMPADQFKFFCHLIAHAATQSTPGVVLGDAYSISRACRCKPASVPSYVSRLINTQLIQEISDINALRIEENKEEKREKKGHLSLPDWVFGQMQLWRFDPETENDYLNRDIFGRAVFQLYPKGSSEGFDSAYEYLTKIIYDDKWLAFVQTCIRNYVRDQMAKPTPQYRRIDRFFLEGPWWENVRRPDGTLPRKIEGSGPHTELKSANSTGSEELHNIYTQTQYKSFINESNLNHSENSTNSELSQSGDVAPAVLPYPSGGGIEAIKEWFGKSSQKKKG